MTELARLFFIFSFATIAFSQYLRTSASSAVNEMRNNSRSYDDSLRALCIGNDEKYIQLTNNEEYKNQKSELFSQDCNVDHNCNWFYFLLSYLALLIFSYSLLMFSDAVGAREHLEFIYSHKQELTGAYCLMGLVINFFVFRSGWKAIKPRSNARDAHSSLEQAYRTLTYTI
ncbi:MAG: hypothetical protein COB46_00585 [Rhodospirillaceae bacterium]|nr:MAG: hypothetical protein COB46_00585 [Rhodospirillaceae bacterium]